MKNRITAVLLSALIAVSLSSGSLAFGHRPDKPFRAPGERMMEKIASDLGLSKEQKEKYTVMAKQLEEESKTIRAKNKEFFDKIGKELAKDSPDRDLLYNYMQQISKNEDQIRLKRMDQMIALRKELTKEQKKKLEDLMKDGRDKVKKWDRRKGK